MINLLYVVTLIWLLVVLFAAYPIIMRHYNECILTLKERILQLRKQSSKYQQPLLDENEPPAWVHEV